MHNHIICDRYNSATKNICTLLYIVNYKEGMTSPTNFTVTPSLVPRMAVPENTFYVLVASECPKELVIFSY